MAVADHAAPWTPPAKFDQFTLERPLGRGGMGHVYLGHDIGLDRPVALKFIASATPSPAARRRFLLEARAIAKLNHPNVVGVYRVGEVSDHPYIAYEFVAGESLDRLSKPMPWETALRLAFGLAQGLEAAHSSGILHRDIKPANAVLSDRGQVKLLDFGLAKLAEPDESDDDPAAVTGDGSTKRLRIPEPSWFGPVPSRPLTRPGTLMGTPAYLAPELWWGEPASTRSDVFALGLVVYELLVGSLPHAHLGHEQMASAVVDGSLPALRSARSDVPDSFAAIIERCLRKDSAERFATAAELRQALQEVQTVFLPVSGAITAVQTEPERLAVAGSLSRLSSQMRPFTAKLYERLFTDAPVVRALFPDDLTAQQDKLAHALKLAVDSLSDPERLAPILEDLGRRHVHYGVEPAHFQMLEKALLATLAEMDAPAWTPALDRAWRRAFAFIESAMRRGMSVENQTAVSGPALRETRALQAQNELPRTRYAMRGDLSIAYQVFGQGPVDVVVLLGWTSHVEIAWQHPTLAGFLHTLGKFARVIIHDKRGTGMSDRSFEGSTVEDRAFDVKAVLDAVGSKSAVFFGVSEGASTAALFSALFPAYSRGVVLYGAVARLLEAPDYPLGFPPAFLDQAIGEIRARWGDPLFIDLEAPSMAKDAAFCKWLALFMRMSASPSAAIAMLRVNAQFDLRPVLPYVKSPALVVSREGDRLAPPAAVKLVADGIGANHVQLAGSDHLPFVGDADKVLAEIQRFALAAPAAPTLESAALMALVVADGQLPSSVEASRVMHGGAPFEDGFAFDSALSATRFARDLLEGAEREGLSLRAAVDARPGLQIDEVRALLTQAEPGTAQTSPFVAQLVIGADVELERLDTTATLRPRRQASTPSSDGAMPRRFMSR